MPITKINVDFGKTLDSIIENAKDKINTQPDTLDLSTDLNLDETMDFDELTTEDFSADSEVSAVSQEELEALIGTMSEEDYNLFIEGIEDYYQKSADYWESLLRSENGDGYEDILSKINTYINRVEHDRILDPTNPQALNGLEKYGITDYKSALEKQKEMQALVDNTKESLNMSKNLRDSAKYDYLYFLKDYSDYSSDTKVSEIEDIKKYKQDVNENTPSAALAANIINFSYNDFKKDYPDMTPLDFVKKIQEEYPNLNFTCDGIKNVDELKKLARASEYAPDMATKYNYLFEQDPEKAAQYLKDIRYEVNNIEGQIEALEFLEKLKEAGDDEDKIDEIIYNEFGVHLEGLYDGLDSFVMGAYHAGEAGYTGIQKLGKTLGIYEGEVYENRVMDVSEYKKMYILQGLLPKEKKEEMGLINPDGTSTNPIIDFSKEYSGKYLNYNYEISQGIGNMLPLIALSGVNPALGALGKVNIGSVALGISAGGNAYHGAMVEGSDYMSALMYGIYSGSSEAITERMLGGLPGLSDVKVTGLKTCLQSMAKEGSQEIIQGVMEDVYQWTLMGKELPTTPEEWAEWAKGKGKEGIYGAITAGYLNTPGLVINSHSPTAPTNPTVSEPNDNAINSIPRVEQAETTGTKTTGVESTEEITDTNDTKKILDYDQEVSDEKINDIATKLKLDINDSKIKTILKSIVMGQSNTNQISNENIKYLVENIIEIFSNEKVAITSYDISSQYGGENLNINGKKALESIRLTFMDFFHESGHAMHRLTPEEITQLTETEINILNQAREKFTLTPEKIEILKEIMKIRIEAEGKAKKDYLAYRNTPEFQIEQDKIIDLVDNMTQEQENDIKEMLKEYKDDEQVEGELQKLGLKPEEINQIMSDKDTLKYILKIGKNHSKYLDYIANQTADYNNYCVGRKLNAMLNSLLQNKKPIDLGTEKYIYFGGHDEGYYESIDNTYGELMADYFSIHTSGNQELIDKVRILLGDEVIDILDNKYKVIADYMKSMLNNQNDIPSNNNQLIEKAEESDNKTIYNFDEIKETYEKEGWAPPLIVDAKTFMKGIQEGKTPEEILSPPERDFVKQFELPKGNSIKVDIPHRLLFCENYLNEDLREGINKVVLKDFNELNIYNEEEFENGYCLKLKDNIKAYKLDVSLDLVEDLTEEQKMALLREGYDIICGNDFVMKGFIILDSSIVEGIENTDLQKIKSQYYKMSDYLDNVEIMLGEYINKITNLSYDDLKNFLRTDFGKTFLSLSSKEVESISSYVGETYASINNYYRGYGDYNSFAMDISKEIDSLIAKLKDQKSPTTLYRGIKSRSIKKGTDLGQTLRFIDSNNIYDKYNALKQLEGHTITEDAYLSTSIYEEDVPELDRCDIEFIISNDGNLPGVDTKYLSSKLESEFLAARDTKLYIKNVDLDYENGRIIINANATNDKTHNKVIPDKTIKDEVIDSMKTIKNDCYKELKDAFYSLMREGSIPYDYDFDDFLSEGSRGIYFKKELYDTYKKYFSKNTSFQEWLLQNNVLYQKIYQLNRIKNKIKLLEKI